MKRLLLSLLLATLAPLSLSGMEKESRFKYQENDLKVSDLTQRLFSSILLFDGNTKEIEQINDLLDQGADVNARLSDGRTPLGLVADRYQTVSKQMECKRLIASLSDEKTVDDDDLKSLEHIIESLLEHGANIDTKQLFYDYAKRVRVEKRTYNILKSLIPNLDDIIIKVKNKKNIPDFTLAAEKELKANQSITIKGREFKLSEVFLGARCPELLDFDLSSKPLALFLINKKPKQLIVEKLPAPQRAVIERVAIETIIQPGKHVAAKIIHVAQESKFAVITLPKPQRAVVYKNINN
jgi:hypothetical protein